MNKYLIKTIGGFINLISYVSPTYSAQIAVYLFSKPKKGKITEVESPFLNTATQESVFYKNIPIATYHWKGSKETVLLIHGWESNAFRWKDLIELLQAQNYNIIAIDAPAHGKSGNKIFNVFLYSECINAVTSHYKIDSIVGHSVGATASAISLHKYHSSIKKLVSLGAPSNFTGIINNYILMMGYNKRVTDAMNTYYLNHFDHEPDYFSAKNFLKGIQAKGLIIHDKKDRIISYRDALDISKHYKDSKLIRTVGFGHGLKNEQVYNHILEFLNA
ncbi:alpha/beta hydrolase family protein [Mariniflexile fucanivorans]|uniref:Alpha/beta hydrolase family protein n=1 Tax=Mariniflexile fucanivorans TaxID=264023 RepID=A0A4R1RLC7_9FLAO|nr:alpha/beta hydrolase [Mariniflexile fucanivorans]TCL67014.1 alpha/beta hydrolase family protein [Mariniflexile fucanivorans]